MTKGSKSMWSQDGEEWLPGRVLQMYTQSKVWWGGDWDPPAQWTNKWMIED
jgi:hypothetical protein